MVTAVAPVRLVPVMLMVEPTYPEDGVNDVTVGAATLTPNTN